MNIPSQVALVSAIPRVIQTIRSTFTMTFEFGSGWEHNSCFPLFTEMFYFRVWQFLPGSRTRFLAGLESVPLWNAHVERPALLNAAWNLKRTTYFFSHTNECNQGITRWFLFQFRYTSLALSCSLSGVYRQTISCTAAQGCKLCPPRCLGEAGAGCSWYCWQHLLFLFRQSFNGVV